jgi:leader peptidase (prepilin peptidase)/N-methyltransferase
MPLFPPPFDWLNDLFVILIGLIVGSFVNVLIHRMPREKSVVKPSSRCPHCQKPIRAYDNIPVLSYLILKGRCRNCHKRISPRYPLVELLVAMLFYLSYKKTGLTLPLLIRDWPFLAAVVAITFIDIDFRIIPDELSIGGTVYGLATSFLVPELGFVKALTGAGIGFGIFYGFAWFYYATSKKSGLGGGDIKFIAAIGAFYGLSAVLTTILMSSLIGSILGISWALLQKKKNVLGTSLPYGPFLVLGVLYHYFLIDFWRPFGF